MRWYIECFFFFQAEDGIRGAQESRGLGDVYKRQADGHIAIICNHETHWLGLLRAMEQEPLAADARLNLSLIHI